MDLGTINEAGPQKAIFDISIDERSNSNAASLSTLELAKIHQTIESRDSIDDKNVVLKSIEIDDYSSVPL